ncbi:MAG: hypothetical protein JWR90_2935 [Marmoricola sp.]|nr:hypothetical protein [Marmoricola sp.]
MPAAKPCMFCFAHRAGNIKRSSEHFLSRPVAKAFGIDRDQGEVYRFNADGSNASVVRLNGLKRRCVCRDCNSGWMNQLEHKMTEVAEWFRDGDRKLSEDLDLALRKWVLTRTSPAHRDRWQRGRIRRHRQPEGGLRRPSVQPRPRHLRGRRRRDSRPTHRAVPLLGWLRVRLGVRFPLGAAERTSRARAVRLDQHAHPPGTAAVGVHASDLRLRGLRARSARRVRPAPPSARSPQPTRPTAVHGRHGPLPQRRDHRCADRPAFRAQRGRDPRARRRRRRIARLAVGHGATPT